MPRIKATIQYCGCNYSGFQVQPNAVTVEEKLETALSKVYGTQINVTASGRTDRGVHALGQVIHFDAPNASSLPCEKLPFAVAQYLPDDISIIRAEETDEGFHARYSCKLKTYKYRLICSDVNLPLEYGRAWICGYQLDIDKMKETAKYFIGEHDFKAFMASGSSVKSTVRTITRLDICANGDCIEFIVSANGFLYNMVRIIVGTLVDVGRGRIDVSETQLIIESGERARAGKTAPPDGLYLLSAEY